LPRINLARLSDTPLFSANLTNLLHQALTQMRSSKAQLEQLRPLDRYRHRRCNMTKLQNFLTDDSGVTAIEYGLIAAGIGVAIVVVVFSVGSALLGIFGTVETKLGG